MKTVLEILESAKDINVFQMLVKALGDFSDSYPATGADKMLNSLLDNKSKVLPKDKNALAILAFVLEGKTPSGIVQQLLNLRFTDLPLSVRPMYDKDGKRQVALWGRNEKVYDKVSSLLDFEAEGKVTGFVDDTGEKVSILDIEKE